MVADAGGCKINTAIVWGVIRTRESKNTKKAEPVSNVEGNMYGPAMRGTDALPWSKNTSPTTGRRRNLGGLTFDRSTRRPQGAHREGEDTKPMMYEREQADPACIAWKPVRSAV